MTDKLARPLATIDLAAFRHNLSLARRLAPNSSLLAVIKADAYGHGLTRLGSVASSLADALAVTSLDEALLLRQQKMTAGILIFNLIPTPETLEYCARYRLTPVVYDDGFVRQLNAVSLPRPLSVWLKLNSGMNRLGLNQQQFLRAFEGLRASSQVENIVAMTHFASADEVSPDAARAQLQYFKKSATQLSVPLSAANSAAMLQLEDSHLDWVRPGLMLYGANPLEARPDARLKPVMQLQAPILQTLEVRPGDAVGYGGTWKATTAGRIGTIALGYADGYPLRPHPAAAEVVVRDQHLPLIGRVSMDLCAVDLSRCPAARVGDAVTFWGGGLLPVEEVAKASGTHAWRLLSGLGSRVRREYID